MIILNKNEPYINYVYLNSGKLKYSDVSILNKLNIFYPLAIYENNFEYLTVYLSDGTKDKVYYLAYETYEDIYKSIIHFNNSKEKEQFYINIETYKKEAFKNFDEADMFMINLNNSLINNNML